MGWLRRDKDCIALVAVAALLLQAILLSVTSGLHAATLASGNGFILCTTRGAITGKQLPGENHRGADSQCCSMSCRLACSGTGGGIVPIASRLPLPAFAAARADAPLYRAPQDYSAETVSAQPRAPPYA